MARDPKRPRRFPRWRFASSLALVGLAAVAQFVVLPAVVRSQVRSALTDLGYADPRFDVTRATLWETQLQGVDAGVGKLHADSISVAYEPLKVIRGRLGRVVIRGAVVSVSPVKSGNTSAGPIKLSLPFDELALESSTINLQLGKQTTLPLALAGVIRTRAGGTALSADARLSAKLGDSSGVFVVKADATSDAAAPTGVRGHAHVLSEGVVTVEGVDGWNMTANQLNLDADLAGQVTLHARGVDAVSKDAGAELHGVDGDVTVSFSGGNVATLPSQHLTATRAAYGSVELTDASFTFTLERPDSLHVEQLSAGWLGGQVSTKDVRLNPAEPKFQATLVADGVSVHDVLELIAPGRARGEGQMSGPITVKVNGSDVAFVGGQLKSITTSGQLQVVDAQWLGQSLDQDPRFKSGGELGQVKQRILSALSDFAYDRLTFSFAEEPKSGGLLHVDIHGKGRTGPRPQELELELNFRGINDVLGHGLRVLKKYGELTNPKVTPAATQRR